MLYRVLRPKGVSRNQLLNDLLAVALDQVESSLPDGPSHAYEAAVEHHEEGLTALFRTGRSLVILSNTPMDSLEEATAYFKQVLQEHLENKRDITLFAIAVVGGRLKVVEGLPQ